MITLYLLLGWFQLIVIIFMRIKLLLIQSNEYLNTLYLWATTEIPFCNKVCNHQIKLNSSDNYTSLVKTYFIIMHIS